MKRALLISTPVIFGTGGLSKSNYVILSLFLFLLVGCSNGSDTKTAAMEGSSPEQNDTDTDTDTDTDEGEPTETNTDVIVRLINSENSLSILGHVASIVSEDPLEEFMQAWHTPFGGEGNWIGFQSGGEGNTLQAVDSGDLVEPVRLDYVDFHGDSITTAASEYVDYSCAGGGSVKRLIVPFVVFTDLLNDCSSLSGTHSGEALRIVSHHRPFIAVGHYDNLKLVDTQQIESTLSGRFSDGGNFSFVDENYAPQWFDVKFNSIQNNEPFELTGFNLSREEYARESSSIGPDFFEASVVAEFGVTAHWTQQVEFSVNVDLSSYYGTGRPDTFAWHEGTIVIAAPDGSSMMITIDSSNTSQFHIVLDNEIALGPYQWTDANTIELSRHWY